MELTQMRSAPGLAAVGSGTSDGGSPTIPGNPQHVERGQRGRSYWLAGFTIGRGTAVSVGALVVGALAGGIIVMSLGASGATVSTGTTKSVPSVRASTRPQATTLSEPPVSPVPVQPLPPALGTWSGRIPITHDGNYTWTSNVETLTQLPNQFGCDYKIVGGTAAISNIVCKPVLTRSEPTPSGVGAPAQLPTEWDVSFTVTSYSGSPSFDIVNASARGAAAQ